MGIRKHLVFLYSFFCVISVFAGQFKYKGVILHSDIGRADGEIYPTYIRGETDINPLSWDFAIDELGNMYISGGFPGSNYETHIQRFKADGSIIYEKFFVPPSFKAKSIIPFLSADKEGNLYAFIGYEKIQEEIEHKVLFEFNPEGNLKNNFFDNPSVHHIDWLISNSKGQLLLSEYTYIYFFDNNGTLIKKNKKITKYPASNGEYFFDYNLDDNRETRDIAIYDTSGTMIKHYLAEGQRGFGGYIDEANNTYTVDKGEINGNMYLFCNIYDHNGNIIAEFDITGPGNRIIKEDGTFGDTVSIYEKKLKLDPYGNIFFRADSKDKAFFLKFAKTHYIPDTVLNLKYNIKDIRIDKTGNISYRTNDKWSSFPASLPSTGDFEVKEYFKDYKPEKKIINLGFKLMEDDSVISQHSALSDALRKSSKPINEVEYLGTDKKGHHWVYFERARVKKVNKKYKVMEGKWNWQIIKSRIPSDYIYKFVKWEGDICSKDAKAFKRDVQGVMDQSNLNLDKARISADGYFCYKDEKGDWYKFVEEGGNHFEKARIKDFAKKEKNMKAVPFIEYKHEKVDSTEIERGIEISKDGKDIRRFRYYRQDTLYTGQNLGLDDKNNIYVYVNWFDWLTKDKMKEVLNFNTDGEFQNRISLTAGETPVLGLDGYIYTHENTEGEGIIRKYEPKTLP